MRYAGSLLSMRRNRAHEPLGGVAGAGLPGSDVESGAVFFFGSSSRNLLSSSSVNPLAASDLSRCLAVRAASSLGACNNVRRQEDDQLGLGLALLLSA